MKNKKYYSSKIQSKKLYKDAKWIPLTHKYKITHFTWLGTGASIQKMTRVEVKLVLCTKTLHRP
jgi:hypothetical protein